MEQQYPGWIKVDGGQMEEWVRASEVISVHQEKPNACILHLRGGSFAVVLRDAPAVLMEIQNAELAQQDNMMRHVQGGTRSMMGLRAESFNTSPTPDPIAWFAHNSPRRSGGTVESGQEPEPAE